jgi:hypothetical protein
MEYDCVPTLPEMNTCGSGPTLELGELKELWLPCLKMLPHFIQLFAQVIARAFGIARAEAYSVMRQREGF